MGTIFLMLAVLALNYSLTMIVAPQYSHFGNQRYCNHTIGDFGEVRDCSSFPELILPCTASADAEEVCTPAVVSTFINRITLAFPFFGEVAFWSQFAFLGVWLLVGLTGILKRPKLDESSTSDDAGVGSREWIDVVDSDPSTPSTVREQVASDRVTRKAVGGRKTTRHADRRQAQ